MGHDISHIKDIGDIMNIFFNSRIYTNQSFINTLYGQQRKTTRSQDAGCSGTRDTLTISASGIYFSKFHQSILEFAEKNLPNDKKIFLICTYGGSANYKSIEQILDKKHASVVGKFGCKGYDTFGPFKLVGGIAKGHPNEEDMKNAVDFVKGVH